MLLRIFRKIAITKAAVWAALQDECGTLLRYLQEYLHSIL